MTKVPFLAALPASQAPSSSLATGGKRRLNSGFRIVHARLSNIMKCSVTTDADQLLPRLKVSFFNKFPRPAPLIKVRSRPVLCHPVKFRDCGAFKDVMSHVCNLLLSCHQNLGWQPESAIAPAPYAEQVVER